MHVHVSHPDGEAKFWLVPDVEVATVVGLSTRQVVEAKAMVEGRFEEIADAWHRHFGS